MTQYKYKMYLNVKLSNLQLNELKSGINNWYSKDEEMDDLFNCCLTAPQPTLGHCQGGSLTHPMLITAFFHIWLKSHQEPRTEDFMKIVKSFDVSGLLMKVLVKQFKMKQSTLIPLDLNIF